MTRTVSIQNLPASTQELLSQIAPDEKLIVERAGHPVVRITPVPRPQMTKRGPRPLGLLKGKIWIASDFDDELPDEFWCPPDDPLTK